MLRWPALSALYRHQQLLHSVECREKEEGEGGREGKRVGDRGGSEREGMEKEEQRKERGREMGRGRRGRKQKGGKCAEEDDRRVRE